MKRILLLTFLTLFSVKAMAFYFGPVQRVTTIGYDKYTVVEMFVDSKESSDFVFRVGDKKIADKNGVPYKKYVFGGERATFPIKVNNKFIRERSNGKKYVKICAMQVVPQSQIQPEVCFNVDLE